MIGIVIVNVEDQEIMEIENKEIDPKKNQRRNIQDLVVDIRSNIKTRIKRRKNRDLNPTSDQEATLGRKTPRNVEQTSLDGLMKMMKFKFNSQQDSN